MADNNSQLLADAQTAAETVDSVYQMAVADADLDKMEELKPQVDLLTTTLVWPGKN